MLKVNLNFVKKLKFNVVSVLKSFIYKSRKNQKSWQKVLI